MESWGLVKGEPRIGCVSKEEHCNLLMFAQAVRLPAPHVKFSSDENGAYK